MVRNACWIKKSILMCVFSLAQAFHAWENTTGALCPRRKTPGLEKDNIRRLRTLLLTAALHFGHEKGDRHRGRNLNALCLAGLGHGASPLFQTT